MTDIKSIKKSVKEELLTYGPQTAQYVADQMDEQIVHLANLIATNPDVQKFVTGLERLTQSKEILRDKVMTTFEGVTSANGNVVAKVDHPDQKIIPSMENVRRAYEIDQSSVSISTTQLMRTEAGKILVGEMKDTNQKTKDSSVWSATITTKQSMMTVAEKAAEWASQIQECVELYRAQKQ